MKKYDFKKEWPQTQKQLQQLIEETMTLVKKGKKELKKYSYIGKTKIDETALNLKREHLFYLIGKEYVHAKSPSAPSAKLQQLLKELTGVEKELRQLKRRLNVGTGKRNT